MSGNNQHEGFSVLKPDLMAVHYIKHMDLDHCEGDNWPDSFKYNQMIATGCGEIGKSGPFHNESKLIDMYDAWLYYTVNGTDVHLNPGSNGFVKDPLTNVVYPKYWRLNGYNNTKHAKMYDITKKFVRFAPKDCDPPGSVG